MHPTVEKTKAELGKILTIAVFFAIWATRSGIVMLLLVFVTMQEISRVLGKGQLTYMFLGHKRTPDAEVRRARAA